MSETLGIGSTVWRFDVNCREYQKGPDGRSYGGPIYRAHWRECTIEGETSRSWLIGKYRPEKVPKQGTHRGWAFTFEEVDDNCWIHDHRYGVSRAVNECRDATKLRAIAEIVGWKP